MSSSESEVENTPLLNAKKKSIKEVKQMQIKNIKKYTPLKNTGSNYASIERKKNSKPKDVLFQSEFGKSDNLQTRKYNEQHQNRKIAENKVVQDKMSIDYPDRTKNGLISDILKKWENPWMPLPNDPIYKEIDGIFIFDNTSLRTRAVYKERNTQLKQLLVDKPPLFSPLVPSTLTAQGEMSGIKFEESKLIHYLSDPVDHMIGYGCNYGEKWNPIYYKPEKKKTSGRGRKPKPKPKSKRKVQGNGKYFSSQISFLIKHPDMPMEYKIKLFRNGGFQVPGVRNPNMIDLVPPIKILRNYLEYNFGEKIVVKNFHAVMRNYKAKLINPYYHVNLEALEDIILSEKNPAKYDRFVNNMLSSLSSHFRDKAKTFIQKYNPLNIAEMVYNMDRCFSLIIKFYRPSLTDPKKKITIKLLKKGKINFDGGNSQQEVEELYYWFNYIYDKHKDTILTDIRTIKNETDDETSSCSEDSIYDDELPSEDEEEIKAIPLPQKKVPMKYKSNMILEALRKS